MNPTTANLERIDAWLERLAEETDRARQAEDFTAYLGALSRFWRYSQRNSLLIFAQRPTATLVNSRKRWGQMGYTVKDGHWRNSIGILCPHIKTVKNPDTGEETELLTHFSTGYIYDREDMEAGPDAQPLSPPWTAITGDHGRLYALLLQVCRRLGMSVTERDDWPDDLRGSSDGRGHIMLNSRPPIGDRTKTLAHELAHELVHPGVLRDRQGFTRQEAECQAESISYCVLAALGVESINSPTYLALYGVTKETLRKNAEAIARGVKRIMAEVERATTSQTTADVPDSAGRYDAGEEVA